MSGTAMAQQITNQPNERGYPKLARLMADSPEAAVFRQFRQLQMINLLRLQATLQGLENEYRDIRAKDARNLSQFNLVDSFHLVRESAKRDGESEHNDVLIKIEKYLKRYNDALMQVMAISQARKPKQQYIKDLSEWLTRPSMGNNFLDGVEAMAWDERNHHDLINPASKGERSGYLLTLQAWLDRLNSSKKDDPGMYDFRLERRLNRKNSTIRAADAFAALLLSGLITLVVAALFYIKRMELRLLAMLGFTIAFSVSLTVFTDAKKIEVYSVTAAFAAVEVVFIGSTTTSMTKVVQGFSNVDLHN
ncbi:hypothetical protein F5Y04DRAFT_293134 [Hypomontagnella monticulosa]|nr:hypothetical protein F5Y04DRAFT_293134 [Hypomontagnella monticulosa]